MGGCPQILAGPVKLPFPSCAGGDNEVQRTMLEIVNQLDGFDSRGNIKVLMATNRPDTLDPALMRPGRLDRKVTTGPCFIISCGLMQQNLLAGHLELMAWTWTFCDEQRYRDQVLWDLTSRLVESCRSSSYFCDEQRYRDQVLWDPTSRPCRELQVRLVYSVRHMLPWNPLQTPAKPAPDSHIVLCCQGSNGVAGGLESAGPHEWAFGICSDSATFCCWQCCVR